MKNKAYLVVCFIIVVCMVLTTGCSTGTAVPSTGTAVPSTGGNISQLTASPEQGAPTEQSKLKTLILAVDPDYETFDPGRAYEVYADLAIHPCYDTLLMYKGGDTSTLVMDGAESYQISDDGLTYTFQLLPGQHFSSGREVTAADYQWSIERGRNLKGNAAFMTDNIASVTTDGNYTLIIKLTNPDAAFLTKLTYGLFAAIDKDVAMANGATGDANAATTDTARDWFNYHSAGSGPYMIDSFIPTTGFTMVRNPYYSGTAPYYDKIIVKVVTDTSSQLMLVKAGDVDIAMNVDPSQVSSLVGVAGIDVHHSLTASTAFIIMNRSTQYGPISNPLVQQAVRYALDYKGILTLASEGTCVPVGPFPVGFAGSLPCYNDPASLQDLDKARSLMAQAGYASGFTVDFIVPTWNILGVDYVTLAQKIQADLAGIGITVKIDAQDPSVAQETYRNGQQPMGLRMWGPDYPDNTSQLAFLPGYNVGLRANWTEAMDPELAAEGKQAEVLSDATARNALFNKIANEMQADSPFVFLMQFATSYVTRAGITGADYSNRYVLDLRTVAGE
jgi:peptide/nickel transport system substrate-binding protein